MKKLLLLTVLLLSHAFGMAQCGNDNVLNNAPATPSCPGNIGVGCITGGQYVLVNVIAGNVYTFSTCIGTTWDTQITLYNNAGGGSLAYNDDGCGLQSTITWTATFTGPLRVLVDQYPCASNSSCANLVIACVGPASVNTNCSAPTQICNNQSFGGNSSGFGIQDLNAANTGCLTSYEHQSSWYVFQVSTSGSLTMTIGTAVDYDFAIWGPYTLSQCPTTPPIRCSYSATYGNTGLSIGAGDFSENAAPTVTVNWVEALTVSTGQVYVMVIDNFTSNFTPFTVTWGGTASLNCVPLPIELVNFDGRHEKNGNLLYWTTATEEDNSYFTLLRSTDLLEWEAIGTVPGAGTSQQHIDYSYMDKDYPYAINYYRLEQTDINGSHEYVGRVIVIDNSREEYKVVRRLNYVGQEVDENYHGFFIEHRDHGKPVMRYQ